MIWMGQELEAHEPLARQPIDQALLQNRHNADLMPHAGLWRYKQAPANSDTFGYLGRERAILAFKRWTDEDRRDGRLKDSMQAKSDRNVERQAVARIPQRLRREIATVLRDTLVSEVKIYVTNMPAGRVAKADSVPSLHIRLTGAAGSPAKIMCP